ncbi:MAG: aldo/keto reductase [Thermoguttaceae bacterium]|jgi:aryl-alcohol dehydrogenase-like predicted oxidoreductase
MKSEATTRREFVRDTAAAAAGMAIGLSGVAGRAAAADDQGARSGKAVDTSKIRNYHPNMEYRRLGKTEQMLSAIGLGGHAHSPDPERRAVVDRCLEIGINYIDSTGNGELLRDIKALGSRRDKVYLALSETGKEPRNPDFRTAGKLLGTLDEALKGAKLEYTDLWRITVYEPGGRHTFDTCCEVMEALSKAKQQGKARFIGISSHDRRWFKMMIEQFPQLEVVLFPFTTMSKAAPKDGLFAALKKCDVGALGIKPFAGGSLFSGDKEEDLRRSRLALRYILHSNTVLPIPGLNNAAEVDNVARAMAERRELDKHEKADLERISGRMWAALPARYEWLRDWQYV